MVFAVFIFLIILSIAFNHKKALSLIFLSIALGVIAAGPIVAYDFVERTYKKVEYKKVVFRQLHFKNEAVLKGFLVNSSKKVLKDCKVEGKVFSKTDNKFKRFIKMVKPRYKTSTIVEGTMYPNRVLPFKLNFKRVQFSDDLDFTLRTRCK